MSYCQRCGEKNLPHADVCENCGAPLPIEERTNLQPGYGYNIHTANCRHRLKIQPMPLGEKLELLGNKKFLFLGNLFLDLGISLLLLGKIFRIDNPLLKDVIEKNAGLFGPKGDFFTAVYCLLILASILLAAHPVFTRCTYKVTQLLPAMLLEFLILPLTAIALWSDLYFGDYMGTSLAPGGYLLLILCVISLSSRYILSKEYLWLRRSGVYSYVAN